MDKDQLIQRLMETFLGELEDHVQALNRDLLAFEKEPDGADRTELLNALFRSAHSLEGAARSVNLQPIESLCHRLETILGAVRDEQMPVDPSLFEVLFASADALQDAGERLRQERSLADAPLARLTQRLEAAAAAIAGRLPPPLQAPRADPKSASIGPPRALPAAPTRAELIGPEPRRLPPEPQRLLPEPAPDPAGTLGEGGFVRIPAWKLDALLAHSGELLVTRRRIEARDQDVAPLRESVQRCLADLRRVESPLRKALRKSSLDAPVASSKLSSSSDARVPERVAAALVRTADELRRMERSLERLASGLVADRRSLEAAAVPLEQEAHRLRMQPFGEACQGLERAVRDLAHAGAKEVDLVIEGAEVELDRSILEALKDPLLHLVRNAVDHGIEPPAQRLAAGKAARARITVAAALRGAQVEVEVADDGRGLDLKAIRAQARTRGVPEPEEDRDLARLVFLPGLSTAGIVTEISGRGMGLDVVKSRLESVHGTVDLSSEAGRGTRFLLTVPLTLTTLRTLLLGAGGQVFALPLTNVRTLLRLRPDELRSVEGRPMAPLDGRLLPLASLAGTLGLEAPAHAGDRVLIVIVAAGPRQMAFAVEELLTEEELIVKSLGARLPRVRNVAGATILASGRLALILNAAELIESALGHAHAPVSVPPPVKEASVSRRRVLVVDDSVTTRTLEKSILEASGYEVLVATDGAEAWRLLQNQGTDLVVSDVEMPRMDGFALTVAIRGSKRLRDLPVVLVTALASDRDKARGLEAGADAYLVKSAFDQKVLLETISQLL